MEVFGQWNLGKGAIGCTPHGNAVTRLIGDRFDQSKDLNSGARGVGIQMAEMTVFFHAAGAVQQDKDTSNRFIDMKQIGISRQPTQQIRWDIF